MPVLDKEAFDSVKPGLSAYADTPEIVREFEFKVKPVDVNIRRSVNINT